MAHVVPTIIELDDHPMALDVGALAVLDALLGLDERWSVYVRPMIAGLQPDFVALHPELGVCVITVQDWEVGAVRTNIDGHLESRVGATWRRVEQPPFVLLDALRHEIVDHCFRDDQGVTSGVVRGVVVLSRHSTVQACVLLHCPPSPSIMVWGGRAVGEDPACVVAGHPRPAANPTYGPGVERLRRVLDTQLRNQR